MLFAACSCFPDLVGLAPSCLFRSSGVCCVGRFIPRRSMVVVDQAVSGSVRKILSLPDYEGSVTGSLRCFLRVLGGGGLAVIGPRAFSLNTCHRDPFGQFPCYV